jgi:hypothetical protein
VFSQWNKIVIGRTNAKNKKGAHYTTILIIAIKILREVGVVFKVRDTMDCFKTGQKFNVNRILHNLIPLDPMKSSEGYLFRTTQR